MSDDSAFTLGVARRNAAVGVRGKPEFGFDSNALASRGNAKPDERRKTSVERHKEAHSAETAAFKFFFFFTLPLSMSSL